MYDKVHKYLRITDIDDDSREFDSTHLTSPDISFDENEEYRLKTGDLLFARTGASTGKSYLYNSDDGIVYFAGFLIRMSIIKSVDAMFVYQTTLTANFKNFVRIYSQRSGQPGINAEEYGNYSIYMPEFKEQQMVGRILEKLDQTIASNQRAHFRPYHRQKLMYK